MAKNKKRRTNIVYSTNPDFNIDNEEESIDDDIYVKDQKLYVSIDRKQRKGKAVTLIEGFKGSDIELKDLCKTIKIKCGVGGAVKDRNILIQGELRDKVISLLNKAGFQTIKKGG